MPDARAEYMYCEDHCDVETKDELKKFRAYRTQWIEKISHIEDEILNMNLEYAHYKLIEEIDQRLENDGLNSMDNLSYEIIMRYFQIAQFVRIRRALDGVDTTSGLRALYNDIKSKKACITRETFVCFDGLPYDYESVKRPSLKEIAQVPHDRSGKDPSKGPEAWQSSERLHKHFDILSGVCAKYRKRRDPISETLFDRLDTLTDRNKSGFRDIEKYIDSVVVHKNFKLAKLKNNPEFDINKVRKMQLHVAATLSAIRDFILCAGESESVASDQSDLLSRMRMIEIPEEYREWICHRCRELEAETLQQTKYSPLFFSTSL